MHLLSSSRSKAGLFGKICPARDSVILKRKWTWAWYDTRYPHIWGGPFSLNPIDPTSSWLPFCTPRVGIISALDKQSMNSVSLTQVSTQTARAKFSSYYVLYFCFLSGHPFLHQITGTGNDHALQRRPCLLKVPWSYRLQHCNQTKMWHHDPNFHNDTY